MTKFTGTDGADFYGLQAGHRDIVDMRGGDDQVAFTADQFDPFDRIEGGTGNDRAILSGGAFYNLGHGRLLNFETLVMGGQGDFEVYIDDSLAAAGQTLTIDALALEARGKNGGTLFFDGAPERDASLNLRGGAGDDVLIGGGQADLFVGGRGKDLMTGNEGADTFAFVADSKGDAWGKDRVTDFHSGEDRLIFVTNSISSFDQLVIERTRDGTVIRTPDSDSAITLLGVLPRDLHASDVSFQPLGVVPPSHAPVFAHDHGLLV